jgi:uncharacterized membrane protein
MRYLLTYVVTAVVFCVVDLAWVMTVVHAIFSAQIGALLAPAPNLVATGLFYVAYPVGIVVFAAVPAGRRDSTAMAAALGALLGLMAYGTYETTNMATLRDWTWTLVAIDTGWGTFVTAGSAMAGRVAFAKLAAR